MNPSKGRIIKLFTFCLLFFSFFLYPADFDVHSWLKEKTKEYFPEAVKIRRYLHQCPEPCFKEHKTSAYIADYLKKCGLEVHTGIAGTGIKAILRGAKEQPVVGIRSDMDALPILEKTGLEFQSRHQGFMHACGHDAHMTNVLVAAKLLSEIKEKIPGTIVFIFQPCEEGAPDGSASGADCLIKEGILDNPKINAMVGLHVMPGYPAGTVALREGPIMANVASVYITINGKSSHGAFPHQGVDAIYAAACAITQFQSLISRRRDPNERAVLSIGKINGGVRLNVIADKVEMEGTVRTFSFETQDMIEKGMENILKGLQTALGITYEFKFEKTSQYVKNDKNLTRMVLPVFKKLLGDQHVVITDPVTVGEDFSAYSHRIPSFFFFLGAGEQGKLHSPTFSVDEKILQYGPLLLSSAALEFLKR
ncbi:MAG: amidohydrolase [Candidatus Aminicenantes bacterium]|jgi:amidohydrolase